MRVFCFFIIVWKTFGLLLFIFKNNGYNIPKWKQAIFSVTMKKINFCCAQFEFFLENLEKYYKGSVNALRSGIQDVKVDKILS